MGTISFDEKSFIINKKPFFIYSGEIHYFRIPKDLWEDRIIKIRRAFLNSVSIYFAWNWHEQEEGKFNFSSWQDIEEFLSLCEKNGLYIIARPGPYICAEWDFGGFPNWLIGKNVVLRSLDKEFLKYALRYYDYIIPFIRNHLITNDGKVILFQIENEYFWGNVPYLVQLYEEARKRGIDVPIVHNVDRFLRGTQIIDAIDLYPNAWGIEDPERQAELLSEEQPDKPKMVLELEGGWFATFGGKFPTERGDFPAGWTDTLVKSLIFKEINAINFYMIHGGTNFGYWTGKNITSSYDYQAAIREWGELGDRYWVIRRIGALIDSFTKQLTSSKVDPSFVTYKEDQGIYVCARVSEDGRFILVRNLNDQQKEVELQINEIGKRRVKIDGKSSLILPCNLKLPNDWVLEFSTAQVFYSYELNGRTTLILYGKENEEYEVSLLHPISKEREEIKFKVRKEDEFKLVKDKKSDLLLVLLNEERASRTWFAEHEGKKIAVISGFNLLRDYSVLENNTRLNIEYKKGDEKLVNIIIPYAPREVKINGKVIESKFDPENWILSFSLPNVDFEDIRLELNGEWKVLEETLDKVKNSEFWIETKDLASPESLGMVKNGHIWYYNKFYLSKRDKYTLFVPRVNDYATIFINGKFIGYIKHNRKFELNENLIREGENEIMLLIESTGHRNDGILPIGNGLNEPIFIGKEESITLTDPSYKLVSYQDFMKPGIPASFDYSKYVNRPDEIPKVKKLIKEKEGWNEIKEEIKVETGIVLLKYSFKIKDKRNVAFVLPQIPGFWGRATIFLNSVRLKTIPFAEGKVGVDITKFVKQDEDNEIILLLDGVRSISSKFAPCLEFYDIALRNNWKLHEGLLGEREEWFSASMDDSSLQEEELKNVPKSNEKILWIRKKFSLNKKDETIAPLRLRIKSLGTKCKIYLNGILIGRYMKIGPQEDFYLPEPFLKEENVLSIALENYEDSSLEGTSVQIFPYYVANKLTLDLLF